MQKLNTIIKVNSECIHVLRLINAFTNTFGCQNVFLEEMVDVKNTTLWNSLLRVNTQNATVRDLAKLMIVFEVNSDGFVEPASGIYYFYDIESQTNCESLTICFLVKSSDVRPNFTTSHNVLHQTVTYNTVAQISEINILNINSKIYLRTHHNSLLSFTYYPTSINIGLSLLNNNQRTYESSNLLFRIFTSTAIINDCSFSSFGFSTTFNPLDSNGKYKMTSIASTGSGSNIRTYNHIDSESTDVFYIK